MIRYMIAAALAAMFAAAAPAQACTPLPYNLTNGSPADATQVMGDFNGVLACPLFSGNVGIGTTTPSTLLSLGTGITTIKVALFDGGTSNLYGIGVNPGALSFGAGIAATGTPQMVLTSIGYVGIATTTPDALLSLGNGVTTIKAAVYDGGTSSLYGIGVNSGELTFGASIAANGTPQMVLTATGDVGIGTTSPTALLYVNGTTFSTTGWSTASDGRLKAHVEPISGALAVVEKLQGVRFQWLQPDGRTVGKSLALPVGPAQIGFVAQDVDKVVPEAVSKPAPGTDGVYGMDATKLIPLLVEAIKAEQGEIDEQTREIRALQAALLKPATSAK
jgi:Chaperone of endosialidase